MSFLGSALGPIAGSIGSFFAGGASARQQYANQQALMAQAAAYQRESLQNRHQWEVEDLRKAGLNPILSATNSAGGSISVSPGTAAAPDYSNVGKLLGQIAHSALAKKQYDLAEYQAGTDRIKADADMIRARQEEAKTSSAIELNKAQSEFGIRAAGLAVKQTEMLDKNYELQKIYNEAQVREIDQRIINSVAEVKAKVQYLRDSGQAALMSASAAQTSAQAAMQNAASQAIIAEVARQNGISQRTLNNALEGKASAETKEAYERALRVAEDTKIAKSHNPIAQVENQGGFRIWTGLGEILRNGIGGASGFFK